MVGMRGGAKAKDFKGSLKKLVKYMSVYKVQMLFVAVFAVCGTVFNIVGPKILGKVQQRFLTGLSVKYRADREWISEKSDRSFLLLSVCM